MSFFFDINKFYQKGYSSLRLPNNHYQKIKALLDKETWVEDKDGIFKSLPSFFSGGRKSDIKDSCDTSEFNASRKRHIEHFPASYIGIIEDLFLDPLITGDWQSLYDLELQFLDMWNGAEDNPWHFESSSEADIVFLIYLTNEGKWKKEWGGYLDVGERSIPKGGLPADFSDINVIGTVYPDNRNMVIMNNKKLNTAHRSFSVKGERQRIVITGEIKLRIKENLASPSRFIITE